MSQNGNKMNPHPWKYNSRLYPLWVESSWNFHELSLEFAILSELGSVFNEYDKYKTLLAGFQKWYLMNIEAKVESKMYNLGSVESKLCILDSTLDSRFINSATYGGTFVVFKLYQNQ